MTVADLIKKLQNYDQNTNVLIHCGDCVNDWYDDPDTDGPDAYAMWYVDDKGTLIIDTVDCGK